MNFQMLLKPLGAVPSHSDPKPLYQAPNCAETLLPSPPKVAQLFPVKTRVSARRWHPSVVPALPRQQGHNIQVSNGYTEIRAVSGIHDQTKLSSSRFQGRHPLLGSLHQTKARETGQQASLTPERKSLSSSPNTSQPGTDLCPVGPALQLEQLHVQQGASRDGEGGAVCPGL